MGWYVLLGLAFLLRVLWMLVMVVRSPEARELLFEARAESLGVTLARALTRSLTYCLFGFPIGVALIVMEAKSPPSLRPDVGDIGVAGAALMLMVGWAVAGVVVPAMVGYTWPARCSPEPEDVEDDEPRSRWRRAARWIGSEVRGSSLIVARIWRGKRVLDDLIPRRAAPLTRPVFHFVGLIVGLWVLGFALVAQLIWYYYVGLAYSAPAWVPLGFDDKTLQLLNTRPFLVSLGAAFVIFVDVLGAVKGRLVKSRFPGRWSASLVLIDIVAMGFLSVMFEDAPSSQLSVSQAVGSGTMVALVFVCGIDLVQAVLSLERANLTRVPRVDLTNPIAERAHIARQKARERAAGDTPQLPPSVMSPLSPLAESTQEFRTRDCPEFG